MKPVANSLFWRSALMIAGLLVASQLVLTVSLYIFVQRPRIDFARDLTLVYLNNVRQTLQALPAGARAQFLGRTHTTDDLRVTRESPNATPADDHPPAIISFFLRDLQKQLEDGEKVLYQATPTSSLWVSLQVDREPYWVVLQLSKLNVDAGSAWLYPMLISFALAAAGGVAIHRTLNKPFEKLQTAARRIGNGERPETLATDGLREVAELSRAFNCMASDLEQTDSQRRVMLAGVSHDLRTPVTRLQLALEVDGNALPRDVRERMLANLHTLDASLTQFLDFARDERDEPIIVANLHDVSSECIANFQAQGNVVEIRGTREGGDVAMRPRAILRMLNNLIENAVKYSSGGIEVEIIATNGTHGPTLVVRDHGEPLHGMDFSQLRRAFIRQDAARNDKPGTGLGLAIVDRIAALHTATLTFTAREAGGLEVAVRFARLNVADTRA
jgi:two-component system, OmpR family, osmolarity sensor histidine kinase EnvZ